MSNSEQFNQVLLEWVKVFTHRSMYEFARWMSESNLSRSQIGALMQLHHQGHCPVTSIGNELGITTPAASQLVDRLVNMGLLNRTEDPDDRRVKMVVLSEEGRTVIQHGFNARLGWMEDLTVVIPESKQQEIAHTLSILVEAAHKIGEESKLPVKVSGTG